jgi:hypothetical protein
MALTTLPCATALACDICSLTLNSLLMRCTELNGSLMASTSQTCKMRLNSPPPSPGVLCSFHRLCVKRCLSRGEIQQSIGQAIDCCVAFFVRTLELRRAANIQAGQ